MKKRQRRRKSYNRGRVWRQTAVLLCLAVSVVLWSHCHRLPAASTAPQADGSLNSIAYLEQPRISAVDKVFYNPVGRYSFVYVPEHKQPRWVAYKLTAGDLGDAGRSTGGFRVDTRIMDYGWICAVDTDYLNSGYQRGHLLPSADRTATAEENLETFLFSNVAPQVGKLNAGIWSVLEKELRNRTTQYDTLYIVAGGVLEEGKAYGSIGTGVTVPELFYKVVAGRRADVFEWDAYVMPNSTENKGKYDLHRVTVDSVTRLTGIEFFPLINKN